MSFGHIKIRPSDKLFRQYLLLLRGHKSTITGVYYPEGKGLQVSHFWGRRHENTRFSEENCDLLSIYEHQNFEENPAKYRDWKFKQLGEKEYKKLEISANTYCKRDDKMDCIVLKAKIKELTTRPATSNG